MEGETAREWNRWLDAFFREEYDTLYKLAYRLTGGEHEIAEELVQEAFVKALLNPERAKQKGNPAGWIVNTLKNLIRNEQRLAYHQDVPLEEQFRLAAPEPERSFSEILPDGLSKEDREILIWRVEEQLGYREIANRLGVSETGCRSRVFRAVKRCAELMREEGKAALSP